MEEKRPHHQNVAGLSLAGYGLTLREQSLLVLLRDATQAMAPGKRRFVQGLGAREADAVRRTPRSERLRNSP